MLVDGLNASGVYRSAFSVESWAEQPVSEVVLRNAQLEFAGGGRVWADGEAVKGPGVDARPLPAWGLYARNVDKLTVEDVRLSTLAEDTRPVVFAEQVKRLRLDNFRFMENPQVKRTLQTNAVERLELEQTKLKPDLSRLN